MDNLLIGHWLPAFKARPKRRTASAPKFYFDDVGVVNLLAKRKLLEPGSANFGKAFENWVFHELWAWNRYRRPQSELSYWRLSSGVEVDFVIDDMRVAIEAKATSHIHSDHLKGLRELRKDHPECSRLIIVSLESVRRQTDDGVLILPASEFVTALWSGALLD